MNPGLQGVARAFYLLLQCSSMCFDEEASNDSAMMGFGPSTSQEFPHVSS